MGTNTVRAYGSKGRQDLLQLDPNSIVLVTDKKHPLYDDRVHLPVDESLVLNIMFHGVLEPISVRKNGEKDGEPIVECIFGRQRVKATREANRRLTAEGKAPIWVPATIKRGDDATQFGMLISENAIRQDDTPLENARKVQRYLDMGRTEAEAAIMLGVTTQTIRYLLALLDCAPVVQRAVEQGQITATLAAQEFSKIPREEQKAALDKLIESGAARGAQAKENVRRIRNGATPKAPKERYRKRSDVSKAIKRLMKLDGHDAEIAIAAMKYVVGADNSFTKFPKIDKLLFPKEE